MKTKAIFTKPATQVEASLVAFHRLRAGQPHKRVKHCNHKPFLGSMQLQFSALRVLDRPRLREFYKIITAGAKLWRVPLSLKHEPTRVAQLASRKTGKTLRPSSRIVIMTSALSGPRTHALICELAIQDDDECYRELKRKRQIFKGYSHKALDRLRDGMKTLNLDEMWQAETSIRRWSQKKERALSGPSPDRTPNVRAAYRGEHDLMLLTRGGFGRLAWVAKPLVWRMVSKTSLTPLSCFSATNWRAKSPTKVWMRAGLKSSLRLPRGETSKTGRGLVPLSTHVRQIQSSKFWFCYGGTYFVLHDRPVIFSD